MPNLFVTLGLVAVANLQHLPLVADQEMKDRSTNGRFQSVGSDLIPAHESYRSSSRLTRTQAGLPSSSVSWLHLLPLAPSFLLLQHALLDSCSAPTQAGLMLCYTLAAVPHVHVIGLPGCCSCKFFHVLLFCWCYYTCQIVSCTCFHLKLLVFLNICLMLGVHVGCALCGHVCIC